MWSTVGLRDFRQSITLGATLMASVWGAVPNACYGQQTYTPAQAAILELPSGDNVTFDNKLIVEECTKILADQDRAKGETMIKALHARAAALASLRDHKGALKDLDELVRLAPNDEAVRCMRAGTLRELGQRDQAEADFREALRLNPKSAAAHLGIGILHLDKRDMRQALTAFDRAISLDPKYGHAYYCRGVFHSLVTADSQSCLADVNRFLELCPQLASGGRQAPYLHRGHALLVLNRTDEGLASLLLAHKSDPSSAKAALGVCRAYFELGKLNLARHYAGLAMRLDPMHAPAVGWSAMVLGKLGQVKEAHEVADKYEEMERNDPQAYVEIADVQVAVGRYAKASKYYRDAFENSPGYSQLVNQASFLATCPDPDYRDGRKAVSLALAAHILKGIPEYRRWRSAIALAEAYAEQGEFEQAVRYAKEAIETAGPHLGQRQALLDKLGLFEKRQPYRAPAIK